MKKLIIILMLSYANLNLANPELLKEEASVVNSDFLHKNFVEIPEQEASNFKNCAIKILGSASYGTIWFYVYSKLTSAVYFKRTSGSHNYWVISQDGRTSITSTGSFSSKSLAVNPIRAALGLAGSSIGAAFIYNRIHNYLLDKYQQEALKKIIERWNDVKNRIVNEKAKELLNALSLKYKRNPADIDFSEATKKLRALIEQN